MPRTRLRHGKRAIRAATITWSASVFMPLRVYCRPSRGRRHIRVTRPTPPSGLQTRAVCQAVQRTMRWTTPSCSAYCANSSIDVLDVTVTTVRRKSSLWSRSTASTPCEWRFEEHATNAKRVRAGHHAPQRSSRHAQSTASNERFGIFEWYGVRLTALSAAERRDRAGCRRLRDSDDVATDVSRFEARQRIAAYPIVCRRPFCLTTCGPTTENKWLLACSVRLTYSSLRCCRHA